MSGAFVLFSWPHHGDFVCTSLPKVEHLPPSENKMSNALQMPSRKRVGEGGRE